MSTFPHTKLNLGTIALIMSFLTNRKVQFKVNSSLSQPLTLQAGTPQGSILSPTLFNLSVSDIPKPLESTYSTQLSQFADDIGTWCTRRGIKIIQDKLQEHNNRITLWCKNGKLN